MPGFKVKKMKAADPGVGFYLDLFDIPVESTGTATSPTTLNSNVPLDIKIEIFEPTSGRYPTAGNAQHVHTLQIKNPTIISNVAEDLCIVIPFGSSNYTESKVVVNVTVSQNGTELNREGFTTENGTIITEGVKTIGLEVDANASKTFSYSLV